MHELSIMKSLFRILTEKAIKARAQRIRSITICIGRFSGIEPDLLHSAFMAISKETLAEGAQFHIINKPLQIECSRCGTLQIKDPQIPFACPKCGNKSIRFEPNDELMVENMEVEIANSNL